MSIVADVAKSADIFDQTGQAFFYDALVNMCANPTYRGHSTRGAVLAKCLIVGAAYHTNIDRHLERGVADCLRGRQTKKTPGIRRLVDFLHANSGRIDDYVNSLPNISEEHLTDEEFSQTAQIVRDMSDFILSNGGFTNAGPESKSGSRSRRKIISFCSKYLHCHVPQVVILDRFAARGVTDVFRLVKEHRRQLSGTNVPFPRRGDTYQNHVAKFSAIYKYIQNEADPFTLQKLTIKKLDFHLFLIGGGHHA